MGGEWALHHGIIKHEALPVRVQLMPVPLVSPDTPGLAMAALIRIDQLLVSLHLAMPRVPGKCYW